MPRGENLASVATRETRAKGGRARASKLRAEREEAAWAARELTDRALTDRALARLEELLGPVNELEALRTVCEVLSRVVGRPLDAKAKLTGYGGELIDVPAAKEKDAHLAKLDKRIDELTKELKKRELGRERADLERRLREVDAAANATRNG